MSTTISCLELGDSCPEQRTLAERRVAKADDTRLSWHRHVHPNSTVSGGDAAVPAPSPTGLHKLPDPSGFAVADVCARQCNIVMGTCQELSLFFSHRQNL